MTERLPDERIRRQFDPHQFLDACHRGFSLFGAGELICPPRREWVDGAKGESFHLLMEAEWIGNYKARKRIDELSEISTGRLGQRQAVITLTDLNAERDIEMDADFVTDMRTGAAAALGLQYLQIAPPRHLAVIGTGRVALHAARACDALFELERIVATSRRAENRERFAAAVADVARARVESAPNISRCLEDADAIVAAVPTPVPVLSKADLGDRTLVAMGGDSRTQQLAPDVLRELIILPDHLDQTLNSGEFRQAEADGRLESVRFARNRRGAVLNIGDAACDRLGEVRPQVVYFTGLAALDLCVAVMIYEELRKGRST